MSKFKINFSKLSTLSSLLAAMMVTTSLLPMASVSAQNYPSNQKQVTISNTVTIPRGNLIPVRYDEDDLLYVNQGEYLPLEVKVAANIRNRQGELLIPAGTAIRGQLEPTANGARFVAREIILDDNQWLSLNATSYEISKTETVNEGATVANILSGTFAGAGTATIIAGTTGDRRIDPLEVLGGAAFGTLAGWALPEGQIIGGGSRQVVVIDPNQDLTLMLHSDLAVIPSRQGTVNNFPLRNTFNSLSF
ncbi:MAG: hypothetical protein AAGF26_07655 [Cyanobacteria bacterium P01_G01_bin.49]